MTVLTVAYNGEKVLLELGEVTTVEGFHEACTKTLHIGKTIVAFTCGQVVYPPSYVYKFASNGMFDSKVLDILVQRKEEQAAKQQGLLFDIGKDSEYLVEMKASDLKAFHLVKERSRLADLDLTKLYACFSHYANETDQLTKDGFDACIRELVPGDRLTEPEKQFLSFGLCKIFHAFDRDGNNSVDFKEFITGFSILALGSESAKLQFTFSLFDEDGDGFVSPEELTSYFQSFLTAVLSLNSDMVRLNSDYVNELIEHTATRMCEMAFETADLNHDHKLSYQEMFQWYEKGGDILMPWLSLLDSYGPLPLAATLQQTATPNEALMIFPLHNGVDLEIIQQDVDTLRMVLTSTNLNNVPAQEVVKTFVEMSVSHCLTRSLFESCVRELIPGNDLKVDQKRYLSTVFSRIFDAHDPTKQGQVKVDELASGFVIFAAGSKSVKLSYSFDLFDADGDGVLNVEELTRFIRSFLVVLIALKGKLHLLNTVQSTAKTLANKLLEYNKRGTVSFEEFGGWYNKGGDMWMPWVELYDLNKWPLVEEQVGGEVEAGHFFRGRLTVEGEMLCIGKDDLIHFMQILELSQIYRLQPDVVHNTLCDSATSDLMITKRDFDGCLEELIDFDAIQDADKLFLQKAFANIFYAYDRDRKHTVRADELASGLSLFTAGSKSRKLDLAFDLFDEDQVGELTSMDTMRFLRSFLTTIFAINEHATEASKESVWELLDRACEETVESMVEDGNGMISFEQFAEWYKEGGFRSIPWLELLDIRKWPFDGPDDESVISETKDVESLSEEGKDELQNEEDNVIEFQLDNSGRSLIVSYEDVEVLHRIVEATDFHTYTPETLRESATSTHSAHDIGREDFFSLIEFFSSKLDDQVVLEFFENFYGLHDPSGDNKVTLRSVINGLTMFTDGSKSEKLLQAFQSFGESLDRARVYLFIYEFLLTLFSLSRFSQDKDAYETCELVHDVSVDITGKIFSQAKRNEKDFITFAEFAEWYSNSGYNVTPWLELLDLRKWPEKSRTNPLRFTFKLSGSTKELQLRASDVACVNQLLNLTRLHEWSYSDLHALLTEEAVDGEISRQGYDRVLGRVVGSPLSENERRFLGLTFGRVFLAFQRQEEAAPLIELSSGLSLFTAGNKSDKLELSFSLFSNEANEVDFDQLEAFLSSFLTVLFSLNDDFAVGMEAEAMFDLIDTCASTFACQVFTDLDLSEEDLINFDKFAAWYTDLGFSAMPWLELLNLRKWPFRAT